jgi:hypothetical protein
MRAKDSVLHQLARRIIGALQIYAGIAGGILALRLILAGRQAPLELVLTLVFLAVFVLGLTAGLRLLERSGGLRLSLWFQMLQIPSVVSPILVYRLTAGPELGLQLGRVLGLEYGFQTDWRLALLPGHGGWALGINLVPLLAALYLRFGARP